MSGGSFMNGVIFMPQSASVKDSLNFTCFES